MPELLEPPTKPRRGNPPWTAEQARAMARRSHLPTSARYRKPAQLPQPTPQPAPDQAMLPRLARTLDQIDALDRLLSRGGLEPRDWDMLTRSKERLFKAWVHLAGIPGPGNRKPGPEPSRARAAGAWIADEVPMLGEPLDTAGAAGTADPAQEREPDGGPVLVSAGAPAGGADPHSPLASPAASTGPSGAGATESK